MHPACGARRRATARTVTPAPAAELEAGSRRADRAGADRRLDGPRSASCSSTYEPSYPADSSTVDTCAAVSTHVGVQRLGQPVLGAQPVELAEHADNVIPLGATMGNAPTTLCRPRPLSRTSSPHTQQTTWPSTLPPRASRRVAPSRATRPARTSRSAACRCGRAPRSAPQVHVAGTPAHAARSP